MIDLQSIPPGLVAVTGDERSGKTSLLRRLGGDPNAPADVAPHPDALWLDLGLPNQDQETPLQVWGALRCRCPGWSDTLRQELMTALNLSEHQHKTLSMLSTGSRRKVALVGLLASGATVICLDQPYVALDLASIQVIRDHLASVADHATRTWVVADNEADARLPWRRVLTLG